MGYCGDELKNSVKFDSLKKILKKDDLKKS